MFSSSIKEHKSHILVSSNFNVFARAVPWAILFGLVMKCSVASFDGIDPSLATNALMIAQRQSYQSKVVMNLSLNVQGENTWALEKTLATVAGDKLFGLVMSVLTNEEKEAIDAILLPESIAMGDEAEPRPDSSAKFTGIVPIGDVGVKDSAVDIKQKRVRDAIIPSEVSALDIEEEPHTQNDIKKDLHQIFDSIGKDQEYDGVLISENDPSFQLDNGTSKITVGVLVDESSDESLTWELNSIDIGANNATLILKGGNYSLSSFSVWYETSLDVSFNIPEDGCYNFKVHGDNPSFSYGGYNGIGFWRSVAVPFQVFVPACFYENGGEGRQSRRSQQSDV